VAEYEGIGLVLVHLLDVLQGELVEEGMHVLDLRLVDGGLESFLHVLWVEHWPKQEHEVLLEGLVYALESIDVAIKALCEEVSLFESPGLDVAGEGVEVGNVLFADLAKHHLIDDIAPHGEGGLLGPLFFSGFWLLLKSNLRHLEFWKVFLGLGGFLFFGKFVNPGAFGVGSLAQIIFDGAVGFGSVVDHKILGW
jgi:hypothetical protein